MEPLLWPTLSDASQVLEARGIRFAVIGGLAVSLRGQPRMTVDVDLVVLADIDQAIQLVRELEATPFEPLFSGVEEVIARAYILPLRHRTTGIRVDVSIGMSGFERQAVGRAVPVAIGDLSVPVVAIEDLLVMKALAGRPQDEQDIRGLIAANGDAIDWTRCLALARRLGEAVDVDVVGHIEAARARCRGQGSADSAY